MDNDGKVVRLVGGVTIATYREIADHFGLASPEKGRQKAKRSGWPSEPQNHPADPLRVRVPQAAWEGAPLSRERAARAKAPEGMKPPPSKPEGEGAQFRTIKVLEDAVAAFREEQGRAAEREDRLRADLATAQAEREAARSLANQWAAELATWTAGGPLTRALRALIYRRS